jgi:hypothetical protein
MVSTNGYRSLIELSRNDGSTTILYEDKLATVLHVPTRSREGSE